MDLLPQLSHELKELAASRERVRLLQEQVKREITLQKELKTSAELKAKTLGYKVSAEALALSLVE